MSNGGVVQAQDQGRCFRLGIAHFFFPNASRTNSIRTCRRSGLIAPAPTIRCSAVDILRNSPMSGQRTLNQIRSNRISTKPFTMMALKAFDWPFFVLLFVVDITDVVARRFNGAYPHDRPSWARTGLGETINT